MTLTELYTAALREIGALAAGEVAEPDDAQLVAQKYTSLYAMLDEKSLTAWAVDDDLPDYAEIPLIYMLAFLCCSAFGVTGQRAIEVGGKGALDSVPISLAERMLRKQFAKKFNYRPARPEYF